MKNEVKSCCKLHCQNHHHHTKNNKKKSEPSLRLVSVRRALSTLLRSASRATRRIRPARESELSMEGQSANMDEPCQLVPVPAGTEVVGAPAPFFFDFSDSAVCSTEGSPFDPSYYLSSNFQFLPVDHQPAPLDLVGSSKCPHNESANLDAGCSNLPFEPLLSTLHISSKSERTKSPLGRSLKDGDQFKIAPVTSSLLGKRRILKHRQCKRFPSSKDRLHNVSLALARLNLHPQVHVNSP